jgi:hypothetical protein
VCSYHFKNIDDSPILYYFKGTRACIILGHCSIVKTNNKKQQIFDDFLKEELPVHKKTTSKQMQELCKSKNRAILFYFLQKQNDDFETLSQICETL